MRTWGIVLCAVGAVLVLLGVLAETTAPYSDTLNIGLLQRQALLVNAGLALGLSGVMLLGFSAVVEAIRPNATPFERQPPTAEELFRNRLIGGGVAILLVVLAAYSMWRSQVADTGLDYNSTNSVVGLDGMGMDGSDALNSTDMNMGADKNMGADMNLEAGNMMGSTP